MNRPYFQSEGIKIQTAGDLLTASVMGGALSRPPRSILRAHQIVKKKKKKMSTVEVTMVR